MKITAQLPGVNRPLSVELRLITFVPAIFDSQEENHTAPGQLLLTERSDFRSAEGLVRGSPFGGVEFGKQGTYWVSDSGRSADFSPQQAPPAQRGRQSGAFERCCGLKSALRDLRPPSLTRPLPGN